MVMPLRDDDTDRRLVPFVTYALIAINVLVWLYELSAGDRFINGFSTIAYEITHGTDLVGVRNVIIGGQSVAIQEAPGPTPIYLTLLTSMFMHASWMHIIGNMLYLWIFGDNVEDRMGHGRFIVFYLLCGAAAAFVQTIVNPDSVVPMVGASGAIAGVMGAYLVLYPHSRVLMLFPFPIFLFELPAVVFLVICMQQANHVTRPSDSRLADVVLLQMSLM